MFTKFKNNVSRQNATFAEYLTRKDQSGQTAIRWSRLAAMIAVYFFTYMAIGCVIHYFLGRQWRIERFLLSFVPMTMAILIVLYLVNLRIQGRSANRFRLSTLLGALTIACIFLGIFSWQRQTDLDEFNNRRRLQAQIMKIIGQGTANVSASAFIQVKRPTFNDDDLARIVQLLPQLEVIGSPINLIDLSGTKITDAGASQLGVLDSLEYCFLGQTAVTDASLDALSGLPKLKILDVHATRVTDQALLRLSKSRPNLNIEPKTYRRVNNSAATTNPPTAGKSSSSK